MEQLGHKVARNTLFTYLAYFLKLAVGFALIPFIIGTIGDTRFGLWVIAAVVTQYCGLFDLGMASPFSKYISEYYTKREYDNLNRVVNTGLAFYVLFGSIVFAVVWGWSRSILGLFHFPVSLFGDALFVLRLGILIFALEMAATSVTCVLRGLQRIDLTRKVQIFYVAINAVGTVLVLKMGFGIRGLILNDLVCFLLTVSIEVWLCTRIFTNLRIHPRYCTMEMFRRLFRFGIRVQTSRVSGMINQHFDKLLIGAVLLVKKVTFYEIGAKVSFAVRQLSILVFPVLVPAFSELSVHRSKGDIYRVGVHLTKLLAFGAVPLTAFVVLTAPRIIALWMGPGYGLSARVTQLLAVGYLANVLPLILAAAMQGVGKPHYQMWGSLISTTLNVVFSVCLIRSIGFLGAPLGTALAMILAPLYFLFATHRYFNRSVFRTVHAVLSLPALSCFIAALSLLIYNSLFLFLVGRANRVADLLLIGLQGLLFFGMYLFLLKRFHYLSHEEKRSLFRYVPWARFVLD